MLNSDSNAYSDIVWAGIDHKDHPDYCDAYVVSGRIDGREMTEAEIEALSTSDIRYELLMRHLY